MSIFVVICCFWEPWKAFRQNQGLEKLRNHSDESKQRQTSTSKKKREREKENLQDVADDTDRPQIGAKSNLFEVYDFRCHKLGCAEKYLQLLGRVEASS